MLRVMILFQFQVRAYETSHSLLNCSFFTDMIYKKANSGQYLKFV